jgi:RimJ/RimL family protein N-acetyltransferase
VPSEVRLRDGTRAVIWSLLPGDREGLREAYEHLSPESQFHRFLAPVPHLTEAMLEHLVDEVDGVDHVARVLFVLGEDEVGLPAGLARMIRYADEPTEADVAVTVADEYQGRGVATALLAEMMLKRPAGVERIVTEVTADNPASLAMLRRLGPTTVERDGPNRLHVTVDLPPAPDWCEQSDQLPVVPPQDGQQDGPPDSEGRDALPVDHRSS